MPVPYFPSTYYDTCSGYNVIAQSALPPHYRDHIMPNAPLPRLAGALREPLQLSGFFKQLVRLGNTFFCLPSVVAGRLAVLLVPELRLPTSTSASSTFRP